MHRSIVPHVVRDQTICSISPSASVRDAARLMTARRIGALVVMEGERLVGILTERDILTRVVAVDRNPATTMVEQVMTRDPDTAQPDLSAGDALAMMTERRYRHLPVVEGGRVVAMVSLRDLYSSVADQLQQDLMARDELMFGSQYGLS